MERKTKIRIFLMQIIEVGWECMHGTEIRFTFVEARMRLQEVNKYTYSEVLFGVCKYVKIIQICTVTDLQSLSLARA